MIRLNNEDRRALGQLVSPSWLSGLVAVIAGLLISVGVIVAFTANNTTIQKQLVSWQQSQPERTSSNYDEIVNDDNPSLRNTWPLLVVWTVIGLGVYAIAASIIHSISDAEAIRESLGYVNAHPDQVIKMTVWHIVLRVLAAIVLGSLIILFFRVVVPYSITAAHASAVDFLSATGPLYALLSFAIVVFSIHLQTIFLRMSLGRTRLFPGST